jgi:hypothetical protein
MSGNGRGVPDGSNLNTIVVDHRQTIVLEPSSAGNITFAIVPSQYGAIGVAEGKFAATVNTTAGATVTSTFGTPQTTTFSMTPASPTPSLQAGNYWIVPFNENLATLGTQVIFPPVGGLQSTKSRVVTCTARIMYTGPTLSDSGVAATCKMPCWSEVVDTLSDSEVSSFGFLTHGMPLPADPPTSFTTIAGMAGARIFPARESADVLMVPTNYEFAAIRPGMVPYTQEAFSGSPGIPTYLTWFAGLGVVTSSTTAIPLPVPSLGHSDVTFYSASGLNVAGASGTASITVEVRTCVEYTIDFNSPMQRFAKMASPKDQAALDRIQAVARCLPSSKITTATSATSGWLPDALSWYGRTMGKIAGTAWQVGGKVLEMMGGPAAIGGLGMDIVGSGMARYSLNNPRGMLALGN